MEEPWWDPSRIARQPPDEAELAAQEADAQRIVQEQLAYARACDVTRCLNAATWFTLLGIFGGTTYAWLFAPISLALPLIAFGVAFWSPEQLRFAERTRLRGDRGSPRGNLAYTCGCSSLAAAIFAWMAPLLDFPALFLIVTVCFAIAFPVLSRFIDRGLSASNLAGIALIGALYGYGAAVASNRSFDGYASWVVPAPIVDKVMDRSKRGKVFHYLHVAVPGARSIVVYLPDREYAKCELGQQMLVRVHLGALGARWYEVQRVCEASGPA